MRRPEPGQVWTTDAGDRYVIKRLLPGGMVECYATADGEGTVLITTYADAFDEVPPEGATELTPQYRLERA